MSAIKNIPNAPTCNRCAHNHGGRCTQYLDEVEGSNAHVVEARRKCEGLEFVPRANVSNMTTTYTTTIETPMATIHKDPWDKITKTYE